MYLYLLAFIKSLFLHFIGENCKEKKAAKGILSRRSTSSYDIVQNINNKESEKYVDINAINLSDFHKPKKHTIGDKNCECLMCIRKKYKPKKKLNKANSVGNIYGHDRNCDCEFCECKICQQISNCPDCVHNKIEKTTIKEVQKKEKISRTSKIYGTTYINSKTYVKPLLQAENGPSIYTNGLGYNTYIMVN